MRWELHRDVGNRLFLSSRVIHECFRVLLLFFGMVNPYSWRRTISSASATGPGRLSRADPVDHRLNFDVYFDFVHVCEKEGTRDSNAARKLWQILKRISRLFVVHVLISTVNNDK